VIREMNSELKEGDKEIELEEEKTLTCQKLAT